MIDIKDAAHHFEAVKAAMRQGKEGHMLILSIHPDEVPRDLYTDPLGSRYMVAMVRLDDEDQPIVPKDVEEGEKAVVQAGMLCRNPKFQEFILGMPGDENSCVAALHIALGINSRAELRTNTRARVDFKVLVTRFEHYVLTGKK